MSERSARWDRVSERSARWDRVSEGSAGRRGRQVGDEKTQTIYAGFTFMNEMSGGRKVGVATSVAKWGSQSGGRLLHFFFGIDSGLY